MPVTKGHFLSTLPILLVLLLSTAAMAQEPPKATAGVDNSITWMGSATPPFFIHEESIKDRVT